MFDLLLFNFVCIASCLCWIVSVKYICSRHSLFKLAARQFQWQRRNEVLLTSLFQTTSKSHSCKAGKELQDVLLPKNQNPQGGSSKDVLQIVAIARLIQSLEAISGAAWENLSSK